MENYQSYLISCCAVMVFECYEIHFFLVFFSSFMIIMLKYAFTHIIFTAHTSHSYKKAIQSEARQIAARTLYRIRVAAHVILKVVKKMP